MSTDSTRAAILDAARNVLLDEGWEAVSQPRVAEVAGVGRATVYRYWPQRLQLMQDVCSAEAPVTHAEPSGDLRADLLTELEAFRRAMQERRAGRVLIALAHRAMWEPGLAEVKGRFVDEGLSTLRRILETGVKEGSLDPEADLDGALAELAGALVYRQLILDQDLTSAMVESRLDAFLICYGRNPSGGPSRVL
ncbi:TetR/AcrR family transcriptional regulator [Sporichthya sp.]|uniref:TetR/AcrR family transcriptional regulator n=1 Tax=Sporichthya sp. TaxID=65475 RepID=UPI0018209A36|nr:TetR/AcrR family transcriptional regulator [Sporichthya sp.]MBA3741466.1 TetR/AcrR family transcriptional regulator [Sporichthya sp.]